MTVYFVQDEGGAIKIGHSLGNPVARLNGLQTGNPRALRLLAVVQGDRAAEQALHERFADCRIRGEWFRPEPRLKGFIDGLLYIGAKHPLPGDPPDADAYENAGLDGDTIDTVKNIALLAALHRDAEEAMAMLQSAIREGIAVKPTERDRIWRIIDELHSWDLGWDDLLPDAIADRVYPLGDIRGDHDSLERHLRLADDRNEAADHGPYLDPELN